MRMVLSPPFLAMGVVAFILVAIGAAAAGGHLLEYPPGWAGPLILIIEAVAALSMGAILAALFAGSAVPCPKPPSHCRGTETENAE